MFRLLFLATDPNEWTPQRVYTSFVAFFISFTTVLGILWRIALKRAVESAVMQVVDKRLEDKMKDSLDLLTDIHTWVLQQKHGQALNEAELWATLAQHGIKRDMRDLFHPQSERGQN